MTEARYTCEARLQEMMRYDLLLEYGGIFLDHDAYALRPLDSLRACCAPPPESASPTAATTAATAACGMPAAVVTGFEQEPNMRKLNPGALMAERNASFLRAWRASWHDYRPEWDYNCALCSLVRPEMHSMAACMMCGTSLVVLMRGRVRRLPGRLSAV